MITRPTKLELFTLLILACFSVQAESNVQAVIELGIARSSFDDQVVSGHSFNPEWALAVSYKSIIELGYTSMLDFEASMDDKTGIQYEGDFYTSAKMLYLRGSIPLTNSVDIIALIGRSKFRVEALSTYISCILFCDDSLVKTRTETDYSSEESGLALGVGMGFKIKEHRQLIIQYVDYNYGGEFDFNAFTLSYRWLFDLPI
jgi:hypothetical protein